MSNYTLDAVGNRITRQTIAENDSYTYDPTYQLTGVQTKWVGLEAQAMQNPTYHVASGVTKTVAVTYDPMGNRASYRETYTGGVGALNKTYAYSPANEMLSDGGVGQTFDNNGNLTNRGGVAFTWDARNRLVGVGSGWSAVYDFNNHIAMKADGNMQIIFIYDVFGRNLFAEVDGVSGIPKNVFSYDGMGLIGQANVLASGKLNQTYSLYDGLGSVLTVTDNSNKTLANYITDAFGVSILSTNYETPFRYTGRWGSYTDRRAGVLNWNRWYIPEQSRWGSRDLEGIRGEYNLYGFVFNNPNRHTDTFGTGLLSDTWNWWAAWFSSQWQNLVGAGITIATKGKPASDLMIPIDAGNAVNAGGALLKTYQENTKCDNSYLHAGEPGWQQPGPVPTPIQVQNM
jgi:RHS repeat-associated protein